MCNMAAYAGNRPAAPILFRMIQQQEALGGGHYTGIATVSDGVIHLRKVIGPASELLRRYPDVLSLPGTVGIAHSRTPGFDSDAWAQPFLSHDEQVIYCANGIHGIFQSNDYKSAYLKDKADGIVYRTAVRQESSSYPVMDDGFCVHSSEVMANLIRRLYLSDAPFRQTLADAIAVLPSEVAALALSVREPACVTAIRVNQPLMWGRDSSGFYLATAAVALEDAGISWINPVPTASAMTMSKENIVFQAMDGFADKLTPCNPQGRIVQALDTLLDSGRDFCVNDLCEEAVKCWKPDRLATANIAVYEYLRDKMHEQALECFTIQTPGSRPGVTAPQCRFRRR